MNILKKSAAVLFGCAVAIILAEIILRIYNPFGFRVRGHRIIIPKNEKFVIENTKIPQLDRKIVHTKNSLGFRGPEPPENFHEYLTMVVVGGSTTECFYLQDDQAWPSRLSENLKREFRNVWINNAGLDGHGTFGHTILMREYIVPLKPALVLFFVGINDAGYHMEDQPGDLIQTNSLIYKSEFISLAVNLMNYVRTIRLGLGHIPLDFENARYFDVPDEKRSSMIEHHRMCSKSYERRLENLIRISRENGIIPVFITQPALFGYAIDDITGRDLSRMEMGNFLRYMEGCMNGGIKWDILEVYNDVTRSVGAREDVWVVDLARTMPKSTRYYYDEAHFTPAGAQKAADLIAEQFVPLLKNRYSKYLKRRP